MLTVLVLALVAFMVAAVEVVREAQDKEAQTLVRAEMQNRLVELFGVQRIS